jgi:hypothetical protein
LPFFIGLRRGGTPLPYPLHADTLCLFPHACGAAGRRCPTRFAPSAIALYHWPAAGPAAPPYPIYADTLCLFSHVCGAARRRRLADALSPTHLHTHTPTHPCPQKNFNFPLANFDPLGVIYLHRKKVGFCLGGSNPKKVEKRH